MTSGSCVVCRLRDPRWPQVCDACRTRLASWLGEIPHRMVDLEERTTLERDDRIPVLLYPPSHDDAGKLVPHLDPVAFGLPSGPVASGPAGPRVNGSREAAVPIQLDAVDLGLPARGTVVDAHHDQIGQIPVAAVLGVWVDAWREHRGRGEHRPTLTVGVLCRWLGDRLEEACDGFPAMAEFADELAGVRNALYGVLGLFDVPDYKRGVPCRNPGCDALNLVQRSGSRFVECVSCGRLLSESEFAEWTQTLAGGLRALGRT